MDDDRYLFSCVFLYSLVKHQRNRQAAYGRGTQEEEGEQEQDPRLHHQYGYVVRVTRWYSPRLFKKNHVLQRFLRTSGPVFNASHRPLTDIEIEALALGPGFIPWPAPPGTVTGNPNNDDQDEDDTDYYSRIQQQQQQRRREITPFIRRINTAIQSTAAAAAAAVTRTDPRIILTPPAVVGHLAHSGWLTEEQQQQQNNYNNSHQHQLYGTWTSDPTAAGLLRGVSALRRRMVGVPPFGRAGSNSNSSQSNSSNLSSFTQKHADIAEALRALHSDPSLTVCLSDTGGTVVVCSADSYSRQALHHLSTSGCYRRLTGGFRECSRLLDSAASHREELALRLQSGGFITRAECAAIKSATARPSPVRFRTVIPTHHQPAHGPQQQPPQPPQPPTTFSTGSPIVSTLRSVARPIDKYLALVTRPLTTRIPFTLTSTSDLVRRIRRLNDANHDLGSHTRTGIYTARVAGSPYQPDPPTTPLSHSVPWEAGISASVDLYQQSYQWLVSFFTSQNKLPPPTPPLFADLLRFVLHNSFIYLSARGGEEEEQQQLGGGGVQYYYHQTNGVTIGDCISDYVTDCYLWSVMRPVCVDWGLAWNHSHNHESDDGAAGQQHQQQVAVADGEQEEEEEMEDDEDEDMETNQNDDEDYSPVRQPQPPQPDPSPDILFMARYDDELICITRSTATFESLLYSINSNITTTATTAAPNTIVFHPKSYCSSFLQQQQQQQQQRQHDVAPIQQQQQQQQQQLPPPPRSGVHFLDLSLSIDDATGSITTTPRLTPDAPAQPGSAYVHGASCHPPHLIRSVPYDQFCRLSRNSSHLNTFVSAAAVLKSRLKMQGYPPRLINAALARARRLHHTTTVTPPLTPAMAVQQPPTTTQQQDEHQPPALQQHQQQQLTNSTDNPPDEVATTTTVGLRRRPSQPSQRRRRRRRSRNRNRRLQSSTTTTNSSYSSASSSTFHFIATFDGGRQRQWRSVRRLLDRVLDRAGHIFHQRNGPTDPIGDLLGTSNTTISFNTLRPNRP